MEAGNDVVQSGQELSDQYGAVYRTIHFALMSSLAVTLAKLFEEPRHQKNRTRTDGFNSADKASLPVLVHFLRQRRCQTALLKEARSWVDPFPGESEFWEGECRKAIDGALAAYASARRSPAKRSAIASLREFRDRELRAYPNSGQKRAAIRNTTSCPYSSKRLLAW